MILAPIGVLVLGAGAAAMMMGGGEEAEPAPLIEPAATGPVLPAQQPLAAEAIPAEPVASAPVVEAAPAPAPVARRATPAPARRAAPARTASPTPAPAERVEVTAEPTGPRAYTATLNAEPATAVEAPPPVIVIQPAE